MKLSGWRRRTGTMNGRFGAPEPDNWEAIESGRKIVRMAEPLKKKRSWL